MIVISSRSQSNMYLRVYKQIGGLTSSHDERFTGLGRNFGVSKPIVACDGLFDGSWNDVSHTRSVKLRNEWN